MIVTDAEVDREELYAGVLVHDIAMTPQFRPSTVRLAVAGADVAPIFLSDHRISRRRADRVWEVAALDRAGGNAAKKRPETSAASGGIGVDFTGAGVDQLSKDVSECITTTRPSFAEPFTEA